MAYAEDRQEQGWSRTAKVTAALATVGIIGGAAAYFGADDVVEKVADAAGVTTDATKDAVNAATEETLKNAQAGVVTDAAEAVEKSASDAAALKDSVVKAGSKVAEAGGAVAGAIGEGVNAAGKLAGEAGGKAVELAEATKQQATETAKGVGEWVKDHPYPATAAGSAIVGTAAYIKGRSDGARKVEQGQAYA